MQTQQTNTLNGLNTEQLVETVDAIKGNPQIAKFVFRAKNEWLNGGENRSTIKDFYGALKEDDSREEPFVYTNGEPPVLLGDNEGANPVEFLLHGLAGCVTTTFILHASARGVKIHELSTELDGDIDLNGLLGLNDSVTPGYQQIRIKMHVQADCSDEEIEDLIATAKRRSPVCNTVLRPVPVNIERAKAA